MQETSRMLDKSVTFVARIITWGGLHLTVVSLVRTDADHQVEQAQPFTNPVIDGKAVLGYGAFGFRLEDSDLLQEFNGHLTAFVGAQEHLDIVKPFGFVEFPGDVTADQLCKN